MKLFADRDQGSPKLWIWLVLLVVLAGSFLYLDSQTLGAPTAGISNSSGTTDNATDNTDAETTSAISDFPVGYSTSIDDSGAVLGMKTDSQSTGNAAGNSGGGGSHYPVATPVRTPNVTATATPTTTPTPTHTPTPTPSPTPTPEITLHRILNLSNDLQVLRSDNWSTDLAVTGANSPDLGVGLVSAGNVNRIATLDLNLEGDRNWSAVKADSSGSRSFLYSPNGLDLIPGVISQSYILYVPRSNDGIRVGICPGVQSLSEIDYNCADLYFVELGGSTDNVTLTKVTKSGVDYWQLSGLTQMSGALESTGYVIKGVAGLNITPVTETGVQNVVVSTTDNTRIASFNIDFSGDLDWSGLSSGSSDNTTFFHYPGGFAALPGNTEHKFTLYIPKGSGNKAYICPGAASAAEVYIGCANGFYVDETTPDTSIVNIGGVTYWEVSGLTGTGGMSVFASFQDILSRLQTNSTAKHDLRFATTSGLLAPADDLTVTFAPGFDLGALQRSDLKLFANGSALTLAATPGAGVWGVVIDSSSNTVTFSAPASGSGYIAAEANIRVLLGDDIVVSHQIVNPQQAGPYEISVRINNAEGQEAGTATVPIVESDHVNVSGFINTFINFDIDTASSDGVECSFNSCLKHSGGAAALNYTVDLGELSASRVNKSLESVMHVDGHNGLINSIYFDLTTNAGSGAVVLVSSEHAGLQSSGSDIIPAVTSDGQDITPNSGRYGFSLPVAASVVNGVINRNTGCNTASSYCAPTLLAKTLFDSNSQPIDGGRVRMDLAAAASYINAPGSYSDVLTFIAVSTF